MVLTAAWEKEGRVKFFVYLYCNEISLEFSVSGRVPCIQASGVWDSVGFLRRCETKALGKARVLKWPRDCPDGLLGRAGLTLLAGQPPRFSLTPLVTKACHSVPLTQLALKFSLLQLNEDKHLERVSLPVKTPVAP